MFGVLYIFYMAFGLLNLLCAGRACLLSKKWRSVLKFNTALKHKLAFQRVTILIWKHVGAKQVTNKNDKTKLIIYEFKVPFCSPLSALS